MMLDSDDLSDGRTSRPAMQNHITNGFLSKPYGDYSVSEQLQIQKLRLKFLRRCLELKRPPPTLRVKGASPIKEVHRILYDSIYYIPLNFKFNFSICPFGFYLSLN